MKRRKTNRSVRNQRALRCEMLEEKRLLTSIAVLPVADDAYAIRRDSAEVALEVTQNDWFFFQPATLPAEANDPTKSETPDDVFNPVPPTIKSVTKPAHGTVRFEGSKVYYKPDPTFLGVDQFEYVSERKGSTVSAKVSLHLADALLAVDDFFQVAPDAKVQTFDVLRNDGFNAHFEGGGQVNVPRVADMLMYAIPVAPFKITSVSAGDHGGTLEISGDGEKVFYKPAAGFTGVESFRYGVRDDDGATAEATVKVRVANGDPEGGGDWPEERRQKLLESAVQQRSWQFGMPLNQWGRYWNFWGPVSPFFSTMQMDAPVVLHADFSQATQQVVGVAEGDVVTTDGSFIYFLSNGIYGEGTAELVVIDATDAREPHVVSRYALEGTLQAEHLDGDRLTIVSDVGNELEISVLDISDPTAPELVRETSLAGDYRTSRSIDGVIHLVTTTSNLHFVPEINEAKYDGKPSKFYETGRQYLARLETLLDHVGKITTRDAEGDVVDEDEIPIPKSSDPWESQTLIVSLDSHASAQTAPQIVATDATPQEIFVTRNSVYLFFPNYLTDVGRNTTKIEKYDFTDDQRGVTLAAKGEVAGQLLNQFSAGEHQGRLQLATTEWTITGAANHIFVIEEQGDRLVTVGSVEGLAPGESIYAARFMEDRAFVVTFRRVDPLFVLDLSDPTEPSVVGELKVPGYSQYLQLIDEDHLIGVGRDADEETGMYAGLQISLFDISDLSKPKLKDRQLLEGGRDLQSPLADAWNLSDHHALSYFSDEGILALPTYHSYFSPWMNFWFDSVIPDATLDLSSQLNLFHVAADTGIDVIGEVEFEDSQVFRSIRIGDLLYSISRAEVIVTELDSPDEQIATVAIAAGATDDVVKIRRGERKKWDLLANDSLPVNAPPKSVTVSTAGAHPALGVDGKIEYEAPDDFVGEDVFEYSVEAGNGVRAKATVKVEVLWNWHNQGSAADVNADGLLSPIDALQPINLLNEFGSLSVESLDDLRKTHTGSRFSSHPDVDNDGFVHPIDALIVINRLNAQASRMASGEPSGVGMHGSDDDEERLMRLLAEDQARLR